MAWGQIWSWDKWGCIWEEQQHCGWLWGSRPACYPPAGCWLLRSCCQASRRLWLRLAMLGRLRSTDALWWFLGVRVGGWCVEHHQPSEQPEIPKGSKLARKKLHPFLGSNGHFNPLFSAISIPFFPERVRTPFYEGSWISDKASPI